MKRRLILAVLVLGAGMSVYALIMAPGETPAEVRYACVQRRDVRQVLALPGQLTYEDERYMYAPLSGKIQRVTVKNDQRVSEGEMVLCMDQSKTDQFMSGVYRTLSDQVINQIEDMREQSPFINDNAVLRSECDCTVRQVLVEEGMYVTAGMPVCRATSNSQEIVCSVIAAEAEKLNPGMWAWLEFDSEMLGTAVILKTGETYADAITGQNMVQVKLKADIFLELPEGSLMDVIVYLRGSDNVLSLPVEAITKDQTVWWVNEGRCTEIPAQIVLCDENYAWVDLPEGLVVAMGECYEGQLVVEADE